MIASLSPADKILNFRRIFDCFLLSTARALEKRTYQLQESSSLALVCPIPIIQSTVSNVCVFKCCNFGLSMLALAYKLNAVIKTIAYCLVCAISNLLERIFFYFISTFAFVCSYFALCVIFLNMKKGTSASETQRKIFAASHKMEVIQRRISVNKRTKKCDLERADCGYECTHTSDRLDKSVLGRENEDCGCENNRSAQCDYNNNSDERGERREVHARDFFFSFFAAAAAVQYLRIGQCAV